VVVVQVELHLLPANQVVQVVVLVETQMFQEERVILLQLIQLKEVMAAQQAVVHLTEEPAVAVAQFK
tara:strand:+ start:302 stop:502 length:201 start_codon:yes stop_codon:yes gene_type:complete